MRSMKTKAMLATIFSAANLLLFSPVVFAAPSSSDLVTAFTDGQVKLAFRYRYEFVDQDNTLRNANASTLRTRVTFKTADFQDLSFLVQLDDVRPIIASDYNSLRNGKTQYSVVADPKGTDLNQLAVIYQGFSNTEITAGRQRIIRGNHRFVGNVGWRQNPQTFDALSVNINPNEQLKLFYSYVDQVNRIFGPEDGTPTDVFDSQSHLFDASYTFGVHATVIAYGYLLDFDNAAAASSDTFGVRLAGKIGVSDDLKIKYVAEFATQQDAGDNPNNYHADYLRVEIGTDFSGFGVNLGYEVLGGSTVAGQSFQTPLATLHGQNGWTDQFLSTPAGGLEDAFISVSATLLSAKMKLVYHRYSAETGGMDYGDEINFVANWVLSKNYSVMAKLGLYSADEFTVDTSKYWMMFSAKF